MRNMRKISYGRIQYLCRGGIIASLYVVLTLLSASLGLASGAIQLRLSEALCVLPFFTSAAIPGLTLGCLIANLVTGCLWQDVLVGTFATFLGALGARLLRNRSHWLQPIPAILANGILIPPVLAFCYHAEEGLWFLFLTVGAGEILSAGVLGMLFFHTVSANAKRIFAPVATKSNSIRSAEKSTNGLQIALPKPVQTAISEMEEKGYEIYAVGGCVRDSLLGRTPGDWDLTTNAKPEETLECFSSYRTIATGLKHGTVTVLIDGMPLEITTYRTDGIYEDHRHPVQVSFSADLKEDLARRDFTVNAMAYHPGKGIVDLFGGQADLQKKVIACVGDPMKRFDEDGLRILRAIRFASVLGFSIEKETARAVHESADLLNRIAKERIRVEFEKLLCGKNAVPVLREYADVIFRFLPDLAPMKNFSQNTKYHCYDVWEHTLHALEESSPDRIVRLSLLFHDCGKPCCYTEDENGGHFNGHAEHSTRLAGKMLSDLRYDNATAESVLKLVSHHDRICPATDKAVKRLLQHFTPAEIALLSEVQKCDRLAHAPDYSALPDDLLQLPAVLERILASDACLSLKSLKINGTDLLRMGFPAGRQIGEILNALLDAVLDGKIPNEKEALQETARNMKK